MLKRIASIVKKIALAAVGINGALVAIRSLSNPVEEDDWFTPALDVVHNGAADILIAVDSKTKKAEIFAPDELVETIEKSSGIHITL